MWPVKRSTFGDEDRIYRTNPVPALVRLVIIVAVSVVALLTVDPRLAILIALVMAVLAGVPLALEFRRAVMISAAEFEYKWATGPPAKIRIADIESIEEPGTTRMQGVRPYAAPGLRLILKSGDARTFPMDFPDRIEIVDHLRAMISRASGNSAAGQ